MLNEFQKLFNVVLLCVQRLPVGERAAEEGRMREFYKEGGNFVGRL